MASSFLQAAIRSSSAKTTTMIQWEDGQRKQQERAGGGCGEPTGQPAGLIAGYRQAGDDTVAEQLGKVRAWGRLGAGDRGLRCVGAMEGDDGA